MSGRPFLATDETAIHAGVDGTILEASPRFVDLVGSTTEQVVGHNLLEWVHPDDKRAVQGYLHNLLTHATAQQAMSLVSTSATVVDVVSMGSRVEGGTFRHLLKGQWNKTPRDHELKRHHREVVALYEIGKSIAASFDIDRVFTTIVTNMVWVLECQLAGIGLLDDTRRFLSWRVVAGNKTSSFKEKVFEADAGFIGDMAGRLEPVVLQPGKDATGQHSADYEALRAEGIVSAWSVPLVDKGVMLGVVLGGYRTSQQIRPSDIALASNLATHTLVALQNASLYQTTVDHAKKLEALSVRLARVQEEERSRIAQELHEGLGQLLSGIRFSLEHVKHDEGRNLPELGLKIERVMGVIDQGLDEIRAMVFDLRPRVLDDFGLNAAVNLLAEKFTDRTRIPVAVHSLGGSWRVDGRVEATLYRVAEEALSNVERHARASTASLGLRHEDGMVHLDIKDDGCGFDVDHVVARNSGGVGIGLFGMKERIQSLRGVFRIESRPGRGTHIHIDIPQGIVE